LATKQPFQGISRSPRKSRSSRESTLYGFFLVSGVTATSLEIAPTMQ
jgi:hypothetical protein